MYGIVNPTFAMDGKEDSSKKTTKKETSPWMFISLSVHSLGIIFGDIGTSPLYVLETIFHEKSKPPNEEQCIGAVSLIIWSLILVVAIKYSIFILQADYQGEGGTFALCALLTKKSTPLKQRTKDLINVISILAASLLIGDGALTPAVSVLSAVEGLALNAPDLHRWIVPITVLILILLFFVQQWGTSTIGNTFAPIMLIWFSSLFAIGIWRIRLKPMILRSFNPYEAIRYLIHEKRAGFYHIGGVFLSVTGCEALYADLGHFGLWSIRLSWFCVVFPSVVANYLGQGALLIHQPSAIENPFYRSVPPWGHWPMVILATSATIIASQAIITGCFSLLSQAGSLGFCVQLRVYHTSERMIGQIYVPGINWILLFLTLFVTIYFQSSSRLTNAYGLTVCSVSVITTVLFLMVIRYVWKKSLLLCLPFSIFLLIDCLFWSANIMKFLEGAWIAILIALVFFFIGFSWYYGENQFKSYLKEKYPRVLLNDLPMRFGLTSERQPSIYLSDNDQLDFDSEHSDEIENQSFQINSIVDRLHILNNLSFSFQSNPLEFSATRVISVTPGIACFLTEDTSQSPSIFESYLRLLRNVPQMIIFLRIEYVRIPFVNRARRLLIKSYGNMYHISARFGYAEQKSKCIYTDILLIAKELYHLPIGNQLNQITFFLPNHIILFAKDRKQNLLCKWLARCPLYLYTIQKSLLSRQAINIRIDANHTIFISLIAEL